MRQASWDVVRRAVSAGDSALLRQSTFVVPVLVDVLIRVGWGGPGSISPFYALGLVLVVVASTTTVACRLAGVPLRLMWVVPLLDLAAVGMLRLVPVGTPVVVLAVLPAMWLGSDHRLRGVLVTAAGAVLLLTGPFVAYFGFERTASPAVLPPLVATLCALGTAVIAQEWDRQHCAAEQQRRRLQVALGEVVRSKALNDAIVSTVDVGLVALDRDGAYQSMNPHHQELMTLAYPDGHAGRAGQLGWVFAADNKTLLRREEMPTIRAMRGETFSDYVIWIGEDPERRMALSISAGPIRDEHGEFDGAVLVYKDVTDLMRAVAVKDEFVASVSHELRTPLTSIMGYVDLVLDDPTLQPAVRQKLDVVRRNSDRLLRMVSDLLLTAQVDQGHVAVDSTRVDLSTLVRQATDQIRPRAEQAQVALRVDLAPGVVVDADQMRLWQVVDNLLTNAVKYTPAGGSVQVVLDRCGDDVLLRVSDTGIGIGAADLDRIFTRFFRSREAEEQAIPGIGLGLAIVKSIVEAHEGGIDVHSVPGRGTTFTVRLPHRDASLRRGSGHAAVPSRADRPDVADEPGSNCIRTFMTEDPARNGSRSPVTTNPARS